MAVYYWNVAPSWLANDFKVNNPTYNKSHDHNNQAFMVSTVLYIDSQYHNQLDEYNGTNLSYGLLADFGNQINLGVGGMQHDPVVTANVRSGRRATNGVLV